MPRRARKRRRTASDPLARERALDALSRMRSEGLSLGGAARQALTTPETIRRYVGSALIRHVNGRYSAKPSDRLTRHIRFMSRDGVIEIRVRSSRAASLVAQHAAAVRRFARTGITDALDEFRGKSVRVGGTSLEFVTDPDVIERLAEAGETSFERLYVQRT